VTPGDATSRRLRILLRAVALVLGAANAGAAVLAQSMNEDGINYLDQADAWMRGDWGTAINGTWSPMYPMILGVALRISRPSVSMEIPVVHLVNLMLFVVALGCFEYFWRRVTERYYAHSSQEASEPDRFPPWMFIGMGYGLFIFTTTALIRLHAVTPDMLVAAFVFLVGGLLLRLAAEEHRVRRMAALGAALGAGYLAKAVVFPLAIVTLAIVAIVLRQTGRSWRHILPAVVAFALVAGPLLAVLSYERGRPTFGDVGNVSYLRHVLQAPFPHYQPGSPNIAGEPLNPITRSNTSPVVFSYSTDAGVTYPPVFDQGHWYAGLRPRFRPVMQLQVFALNLQRYFELFLRLQGLMVGAVLVILLARRPQGNPATQAWPLILLPLAALGLYSLVYAEGRYLAPFIVLLWSGLLLTLRLPPAPGNRELLAATGIVFMAGLAMNIGTYHLDGFNAQVRLTPVAAPGPVSRTAGPTASPVALALALQDAELRPGDRIGVIGAAIGATWARLARLRIRADAPDDVDFWARSPQEQEAVVRAFAAAGVRAVVAEPPDDGRAPPDWIPVGGTGNLMRFMAVSGDQPVPPAPNR
jgi:4-amino-4-deoxy-L-arabinose transferase-like glycosyltransferase